MNVAVKVLNAPDVSDAMRRQFTAEGDAMATLAIRTSCRSSGPISDGKDGHTWS
jgi:hypothetical protein